MYLRDLEGNEHALQTTTSNEYELNSNQSMSFNIQPNKVNDLFIHDIDKMWVVVDHDDVEHKIVYFKKIGKGNRLVIEIKAIPLFFDEFDNDRIYEEYNEHMTAERCFSLIFSETNFNVILIDSFLSVQWEGFGKGDTKLELFKRALNRYKAEFRINGNTIYLETKVGRDTSFMYRYRLNASNIVLETDATGFWTYAKGFGDYEDDEENGGYETANLIREYTSPLVEIVGVRHAPPIMDGRIKDTNTMDNALKELVDESLKLSVTATIHDLRKQGYALAQPEVGDRVFLIDERIGLDAEVRIIDMRLVRNWKGDVLDLSLTFGSPSLAKRHQSKLNTGRRAINELIEGKRKLPYNALDDAIKIATEALKRAQTELIFENGIIAKEKDNPNHLVVLNSKGLGISKDGGNTFNEAITADGFVLTAGAIGRLSANHIQLGSGMEIEDDYKFRDEVLEGSQKWNRQGTYIDQYGVYTGQISANQISVGFNNIANSVKITASGLETYSGIQRTSLLNGSGHRFYRDETLMGIIGTAGLYSHPNLKGLNFQLSNDAYYMAWSYLENPGDDYYTIKLAWYANDSAYGKRGFQFYDDVTVPKGIMLGSNQQASLVPYTNAVSLEFGIHDITLFDSGNVSFRTNDTSSHVFFPEGTKIGGTIKVDDKNLGMSPVDSPQILIEYIEFDIELSPYGTKIKLDETYLKTVSNFAAFSSRGEIVEKGLDYVVIRGQGMADVSFVGKRIDYDKVFWGDMSTVDKEKEEGINFEPTRSLVTSTDA